MEKALLLPLPHEQLLTGKNHKLIALRFNSRCTAAGQCKTT